VPTFDGDAVPPTLRIRRALLRALPAVLAAAAIWLWFRSVEQACEPRFAEWVAAFEASVRSGEPRLPAPVRVADELLRGPVEAALAVPVDPMAAVRLEASRDSYGAVVSWIDRGGFERYLELRCDGASVEVRGVGVASTSKPQWDKEAP
jgi:hypothetical protein